jgi:hypothetical protein
MWSRLWASVSHSDGSFFLLCVCMWSRLCLNAYTVMGRSSCCVLCVPVRGPVYGLMYPTATSRSSCYVRVCMWVRLCASVSHSDGPFFLLCVSVCGPIYAALVYPTVTIPFFLLCVSVCGPIYGLVYPTVTGRSSCCVCMWSRLYASVYHSDKPFFLLGVYVCGPVYALVYPTVTGRSSCWVCMYVVPSMR